MTSDEGLNKEWHKMIKYRFFLQKAVSEQDRHTSLIHIRSPSIRGMIYRMVLGPDSVTFLSSVVDVSDRLKGGGHEKMKILLFT